MASEESFRPDWTSPPSDTILDVLADRGISPAELAAELGQTMDAVQALLDGRSAITLGIARSLSVFIGGSVQFWMTRDLQYRNDVVKLTESNREWLAQLPVGDMIKFGWLEAIPHPTEELEACLKFFGVSSVSQWHHTYEALARDIAFRTSRSFDSRPGAIAAWLRQGERQSSLNHCSSWNRGKFTAALQKIRTLTKIKDPAVFVPKLQHQCAESGVAVSVVRAPAGCRASGATRFLPTGKALVLLSFRHLTDDQFWFTFFHEAGHLVLHEDEHLFLEDSGCQLAAREAEANQFAARVLVPDEQGLLNLRPTAPEVIRFAVKLGISTGIVVGQLQHHGRIGRNRLNRLKRRYHWSS